MELAFTGSLGPFQVALRDGDGTVRPPVVAQGRQDLTALVAQACADAGITPDAITSVRFDLGPGSYTGLRVATTFANLCRGMGNAQVHTITTFELIAAAAAQAANGILAVRLDARRGRWHCGDVCVSADDIKLLGTPEAIPVAAAIQGIRGRSDRAHLLGDPAVVQEFADDSTIAAQPLPDVAAHHLYDPRLHWRAAEGDVSPLYLMGSYAED